MAPTQLLQYFDRLSEAPDAIPRLRRFILDLAVRGKLVEQDPNDEPAVELLKRIEAEKARLVKEGKLKKTAAGSADNSSDTSFDLPRSWVRVCLGDVAQYGLSDKVNSNKDIADDTWVLDLEDIEKNTSRLIERIPSSARPFRSTKTIFKRGDVLFGKLRPYLNKVLVANQDGVCTTEIVPIRGFCSIVPEYIKLVFMSPLTMRRVDRLMYGMKMPRLGTNDAISLEFPLAPLAEQHRIVAKVDELMALCDQLEAAKAEREQSRDRLLAANLHHLNQPTDDEEAFREHVRFTFNHLPRITTRPAHIKQLRQTILNLAVRGKLIPQDPSDSPTRKLLMEIDLDKGRIFKEGKTKLLKTLPEVQPEALPFQIPTEWSWVNLNRICHKVSDGFHHTPIKLSEGIKYISATHIWNGWIEWNSSIYVSENDYYELYKKVGQRNGDILIVNRGAGCGDAAIVDSTEPFCFQNAAIIGFNQDLIFGKYVLYYLRSTKEKLLESFVQGGAQPMLSNKLLASHPIALPPLAEQHRIVAKVDELMALCDQLETQLNTTETDCHRLLEAVLHEALAPVLNKDVA